MDSYKEGTVFRRLDTLVGARGMDQNMILISSQIHILNKSICQY